MDVGGGESRALVLALKAGEGDVVADDVVVGVDAELEQASSTLETSSRHIFHVDNVFGLGDDLVGRCEVERAVLALAETKVNIQVKAEVDAALVTQDGAGLGEGGESGGDNDRGLHFDASGDLWRS